MPRGDTLPLHPEITKVKVHMSLFLQGIFGIGILVYKNANHPDRTRELYSLNQVVHGLVGLFFIPLIAALVTHAFATPIGALPIGQIHYLLNRRTF